MIKLFSLIKIKTVIPVQVLPLRIVNIISLRSEALEYGEAMSFSQSSSLEQHGVDKRRIIKKIKPILKLIDVIPAKAGMTISYLCNNALKQRINKLYKKKQFFNENVLNLFSHFFIDSCLRGNDNPLKLQLRIQLNLHLIKIFKVQE